MAIAIRSAGRVRSTRPPFQSRVARVDEAGQRRPIADRLVEAHERVAHGEIVGVGGGRLFEPLARLGVTPERHSARAAQDGRRRVVRRARERAPAARRRACS